MAEANPFELDPEDVVPIDFKSVWTAMEECQTLGLAKSISVSNFSCKKLAGILSFAKIPPAINQVEMNPAWQQRKLKEFCKANGIMIAAYSPLGVTGAVWGTKGVLGSEVLIEIAKSKGIIIVTKSFNKERLKQNHGIFDWKLSDEQCKKIAEIPQSRQMLCNFLFLKLATSSRLRISGMENFMMIIA
ncbi:Methylecgonone reductase-like protein [Heracleum sosnowskyi]|uniref:Methylecgonone reductase-like protein n=1 Tax=Heracleum sosnowskyi TaxID=360622 RepID=A0AAD8HFR3_9APIA|nr:Methylecgonone reductase-like protein [Heracleum sosnowskyi]